MYIWCIYFMLHTQYVVVYENTYILVINFVPPKVKFWLHRWIWYIYIYIYWWVCVILKSVQFWFDMLPTGYSIFNIWPIKKECIYVIHSPRRDSDLICYLQYLQYVSISHRVRSMHMYISSSVNMGNPPAKKKIIYKIKFNYKINYNLKL